MTESFAVENAGISSELFDLRDGVSLVDGVGTMYGVAPGCYAVELLLGIDFFGADVDSAVEHPCVGGPLFAS